VIGLAAAALLVPAGAAYAAGAPSAITGPVTSIGPSSATATGKVNPNGLATTWYVEYGTSTGYGSKTSTLSAGSGTTNVDVTAPLGGLAPGTSYHYRVVAANSSGTAHGADGIFTTAAAPAVVTGAASDVSVTSARLAGTVDPNGRATTWYFEYGTSTSYGSKTSDKSAGSGTSAADVAASVSGLARGRTYHYRLVATSDAGTTRGADRTFATRGVPGVSTGAASSIAPTTARLNGRVNPNGQSTTWWFEYGTTTGYGAKTASHGAGSGTATVNVSASLSKLAISTTYHYRLVARNDSGTTVGADRTFSTSLAPNVTAQVAKDVGSSTATLTASLDPRGRSTSWYFEYGPTTGYGFKTAKKSAGTKSGAVSAGISGLSSATTYHFRLVATSDAGTTRGPDASFATTGVTLSANASVPVVYGNSVLLTGSVPTKRANESVVVYAQRYGETSFVQVATVLTNAGGAWSYLARPRIQTAYRAGWNRGLSAATTIGVRPTVSFRRLASGKFLTHVAAGRTFAGRYVQVQRRRTNGKWQTLKRVRLNPRSSATFKATLPKGRSTLRIALSVNQAGAGFLGATSRTILVRR
jgi:hypothetical protein